MMPTMESIRKLLPMSSQRAREVDSKYEPLHAAQTDDFDTCHCRNLSHSSPSTVTHPARLRLALQVTISLVVLTLWTALVGFYLARNPHLFQHQNGPRNLADLCNTHVLVRVPAHDADQRGIVPMVATDFQADNRFAESEPYDSPFWQPFQGLSDDVESSAWNYYGSRSPLTDS